MNIETPLSTDSIHLHNMRHITKSCGILFSLERREDRQNKKKKKQKMKNLFKSYG